MREVLDALDDKRGAALILARRPEQSVLDCEPAESEIRSLVGLRAKLRAQSDPALCVDIASKGYIRGFAERLVISKLQRATLLIRSAGARQQESRLALPSGRRYPRVRQHESRKRFYMKHRVVHDHAVAHLQLGAPDLESPLRHGVFTRGYLGVVQLVSIRSCLLDARGSEENIVAGLGAIGEAGCVPEDTLFGVPIDFRAAGSDPLVGALIKDHIALSNRVVGRGVERQPISLQAVLVLRCVDVAFVEDQIAGL